MATYHQAQLQRYCRICAKLMSGKGYKYSCEKNKNILMSSGIDITDDQPHMHPASFCGSCRTKAKRYHDAKQVNTTLNIHKWTEHTESFCSVCTMFQSQQSMGRPTTSKIKTGRPRDGSSQSVANNILRKSAPSMKAGSPLSLARFLPSNTVSLSDLKCSVCNCIVDRPMQTPCGKLECAVCITTLLSKSDIDSFSCTSCKEVHIITDASYPAASDVLLKILGELLLTCDSPSCSTLVALKNLKEHVMSGCKLTTPTFSPSKLTIQQITWLQST